MAWIYAFHSTPLEAKASELEFRAKRREMARLELEPCGGFPIGEVEEWSSCFNMMFNGIYMMFNGI